MTYKDLGLKCACGSNELTFEFNFVGSRWITKEQENEHQIYVCLYCWDCGKTYPICRCKDHHDVSVLPGTPTTLYDTYS